MNARSPSDTKGSNLRTRLREATALAILEAAEEVFAEHGLFNSSMNDIAARAGVAVGTVYNHYTDKDALIEALFESRRQGMLDLLDEQLKQTTPGGFQQQLERVLGAVFAYFQQHRRFYTILFERQPEIYACAAASKRAMLPLLLERFEKLVKRGLREHAIRPELAPFCSSHLLSLLHLTKFFSTLHPEREVPSPAQLVDIFMRGAGA